MRLSDDVVGAVLELALDLINDYVRHDDHCDAAIIDGGICTCMLKQRERELMDEVRKLRENDIEIR